MIISGFSVLQCDLPALCDLLGMKINKRGIVAVPVPAWVAATVGKSLKEAIIKKKLDQTFNN
jgi:hypothetical protein